VDREQEIFEQAASTMRMIDRLYEEEFPFSPLPEDRTGGLRFRKGVPDALLHLSRNNLSAVQRLSERIEQEKHRSVVAAGNLEGSGSRAALASLLYWNAPNIPIWLIGESFDRKSAHETARYLRDHGAPGRRWARSTIRPMIFNYVYSGIFYWGKEHIDQETVKEVIGGKTVYRKRIVSREMRLEEEWIDRSAWARTSTILPRALSTLCGPSYSSSSKRTSGLRSYRGR
jgi:hypothetical protein